MKQGEVRSKGEKERYTHVNAELQRIARRDKKAFLSDQGKEIEGNNGMGKTRDFFKKIRDTKGTFQVRMGSIRDRNGMDLKITEDIKKRWQEYTVSSVAQSCLTLCDLMNHSTPALPVHHKHPEFTQTYARRVGDATQYASKFGKLSSHHRTGKGQFSFQSQRMLKLPHNCTHLTC